MKLFNNKPELYVVDTNYVNYLNKYDSEVFYSENYDTKPYIGIIITTDNFKYFVPLTSAKEKHLKWKNKSKDNFIIYEIVHKSNVSEDWVYNKIENSDNVKHILAVVEIKKMIPVPDGLFKKVDMDNQEQNYYNLLSKELNFIKAKQDFILKSANEIYNHQISTAKIKPFYCDFKKLEHIAIKYNK